jgi:hypothetical protein
MADPRTGGFVRSLGITLLLVLAPVKVMQGQAATGAGASDSPIFLSPRGAAAASLSTADKSVTFTVIGSIGSAGTISRGDRTAQLPGNLWAGLTVTGRAQDGFAGLVSGDDLARDAEVRLSLGHRLSRVPRDSTGARLIAKAHAAQQRADSLEALEIMAGRKQVPDSTQRAEKLKRYEAQLDALVDSASSRAGWLALSGGISVVADVYGRRGEYQIADSVDAATVQVQKETFTGLGGALGIGLWTPNLLGIRWVGGVSAAWERASSVGDLTEVRVDEVRTVAGTSGPEMVVTRERSGLYGDYATFTQMPLSSDLIAAPIRLPDVAVHLFSRTPVRRDRPDPTQIGVGIYLLKDRNPLTPQGGLVFRIDDAFSATDREEPRFSVGILLNVVVPRLGP